MVDPVTILCDVDEVVADLHTEWLRRYNADWDDDLSVDDIKSWSIERWVRPECGKRIYDYLWLPDLYSQVEPVRGSLDGVRALRDMGYRVVFVTSANPVSAQSKMTWLRAHGFVSRGAPQDNIVIANDKSLVLGDILIDDAPHNIEATTAIPLVYNKPYNELLSTALRAYSWDDILKIVPRVLNQIELHYVWT